MSTSPTSPTSRTRPSRKSRRARAMFGLQPEVMERSIARGCEAAAREIDRMLPPGGIALVTGPSGSGKSTILRCLAEQLDASGVGVILPLPPMDVALVDQFRAPLAATLRRLARVGLAEAMLLSRRPSQLSEGQRWRLALALAMERGRCAARGRRGAVLILDEFASTLDRVSARCLAVVVRRWARRAVGLRIVCATAHDDLAGWLCPAVLVRRPLGLADTSAEDES